MNNTPNFLRSVENQQPVPQIPMNLKQLIFSYKEIYANGGLKEYVKKTDTEQLRTECDLLIDNSRQLSEDEKRTVNSITTALDREIELKIKARPTRLEDIL